MYLNLLQPEIIITLISKLTIDDIVSLTQVIFIPDNMFRYLYSLNFRYAYNLIKDVFPLDLVSWYDHYLQLFTAHNLLKIYLRSMRNQREFLLLNHCRIYLVDSTLFMKNIPIGGYNDVKLYEKLTTSCIDLAIIDILNTLNMNLKLCMLQRRALLYIWKHSKIYLDHILSHVNYQLYTFWVDYESEPYMIIWEDLDGRRIYGTQKFGLNLLKFIKSSDNLNTIKQLAGEAGLYVKYIFSEYPHLIESI